MKKKVQLVTVGLFLLILYGFLLGTFISEDQSFSEMENKVLAQKPQVSLETILSGQMMEEVNDYMNDQLFLREPLLKLKTTVQKTMGNQEINGVYLVNDRLIEKWTDQDLDIKQIERNIECIQEFALNQVSPVEVMLIPTAAYLYEEALPKHAPHVNQDSLIDEIYEKLSCSSVDVRAALTQALSDNLYYRTDHHWTTEGAFLAYQEYAKQHHFSYEKNHFQKEEVTNTFRGSLYSKVLDDKLPQDTIVLMEEKDQAPIEVSYNFGKTKTDTVFDLDALEKKDKYQVFLGGNHPEITITTQADSEKSLLIFKDSFANSWIPLILKDYRTINVIDLRYFKQDLHQYITENPTDEILFLYSIKNFVS